MPIKPFISVVIPLHNGERYLANALKSVFDQGQPPDEVWVVDDGSCDGGPTLASRYGPPVHCISQPHRGASTARNVGALASKGELLAFLDADDVWLPDKLSLQVEFLNNQLDIDAVTGYWRNFLSPDLDRASRNRLSFKDGPQSVPIASTLLIRRDRFLSSGGFDESLSSGEFIDWVLRAREGGIHIESLPTLLAERRVHAHNHSLAREGRARAYLQLAKKRLSISRGE